jgi:hypothetical protein
MMCLFAPAILVAARGIGSKAGAGVDDAAAGVDDQAVAQGSTGSAVVSARGEAGFRQGRSAVIF